MLYVILRTVQYFQTDQRTASLSAAEAVKLAGEDPEYDQRDLYNAIALKNFPSWSFCIQTMALKEAKRNHFNPFDPKKICAVLFMHMKPGSPLMNNSLKFLAYYCSNSQTNGNCIG